MTDDRRLSSVVRRHNIASHGRSHRQCNLWCPFSDGEKLKIVAIYDFRSVDFDLFYPVTLSSCYHVTLSPNISSIKHKLRVIYIETWLC